MIHFPGGDEGSLCRFVAFPELHPNFEGEGHAGFEVGESCLCRDSFSFLLKVISAFVVLADKRTLKSLLGNLTALGKNHLVELKFLINIM